MRVLALILAAASAGCAGSGTGSAAGTLWMNECTDDAPLGSQAMPALFDLHPSYFVALPTNDTNHVLIPMNHATLRIQSAGNQLNEADLIYITIEDVGDIAMQLDQPIVVGPATNLRATLGLFRSCPKAPVQLELDGFITFSQFGLVDPGPVPEGFGLQFGDPLTATFQFDVVDRRALTLGGVGAVPTTPSAGGHLDGDFDFQVTRGRAAQPF